MNPALERPDNSSPRFSRLRMMQRDISDAEVERAMADPDIEYADRAGNAIFVAHPEGRRIKVVVAKGSSPPRVITTGD